MLNNKIENLQNVEIFNNWEKYHEFTEKRLYNFAECSRKLKFIRVFQMKNEAILF